MVVVVSDYFFLQRNFFFLLSGEDPQATPTKKNI
jgi:hypothetical protein